METIESVPLINNVDQSIEFFSKKSYDIYKEWIDSNLKLGKYSTIFNFIHLGYFLNKHTASLGFDKYFYFEKYFYMALELKLLDIAGNTMEELKTEFGNEAKIKRMEAQLIEINSSFRGKTMNNLEVSCQIYRSLMKYNQEDRTTIKRYLAILKAQCDFEGMKKYAELWNDYLKIYMDDYEAWYELSDIYLVTNNHHKAIFCLEEVLLHMPNNYKIYQKIGDILSSLNNSDSATLAVKYYSQSILVKPTPRAFWSLIHSLNTIYKCNKNLDQKLQNLVKISKAKLVEFYKDSPFKITIEQFYDIKTE
jgi:tetratricopeptide (TPR) repeat protein